MTTTRPCEVCGGNKFRYLFTKDAHAFFRCRCCRLIRSDPQPTDDTLARIYGTKYYDAWGVQTGLDRVLRLKKETFRRYVLDVADLKKGSRVLDCGAAFGTLMEAATEMGLNAYGIELAEEAAAEIGRRFGPSHVFSGPFEQASFPDLEDAAFDGVFMCDFLEHVRDPLAVLQKTVSFLRPRGSIIITTPDGDSLSCRFMGASWLHYKVEHLYYFNRLNLSQLLQRVGLTVIHQDRSRKVLDLEYIRHQFKMYPHFLSSSAINCLARCTGNRIRHRPLSFSFGEMIVVAIKD